MRARLICMHKDMRRTLSVRLWQIFPIVKILIQTSKHKFKREIKWIYCTMKDGREIRFLWYEVEVIK